MITIIRMYSMAQVRERFKGCWFPTTLAFFLKRERVETKRVGDQIMFNSDQVDELVREIRR